MAQNKQPLNYLGVSARFPPNVVFSHRKPVNPNDWRNVRVGDFWVVNNPNQLWYLASLASDGTKTNPMSTWIMIYPRVGDSIEQFIADAGVANEESGVLNMLGGTNINTSGAADVVTINLNDSISLTGGLVSGGTIAFGSIVDGVMQGDADGVLSSSRGNDGQLLIGRTNANPTWGSLTSTDATVVVTEGPGTLDLTLSNSGVGGAEQFNTDNGVAHELNQIIAIHGNGDVTTSGSSNTVTVEVEQINKKLSVDGTTTFSSLTDGVLQSDAYGVVSTSRGNDGQLLIGRNAGQITWNNLTPLDGSITVTNGPGTIDLSATGSSGLGNHIFLAVMGTSINKFFDNDYVGIEPYKCDLARINIDNNYNPATGEYTAPRRGYYYFGIGLKAWATSHSIRQGASRWDVWSYNCVCYLNVNNATRYAISSSLNRLSSEYETYVYDYRFGNYIPPLIIRWQPPFESNGTIILLLEAGDVVKTEIGYGIRKSVGGSPSQLAITSSSSFLRPNSVGLGSYFSGYMIKPA